MNPLYIGIDVSSNSNVASSILVLFFGLAMLSLLSFFSTGRRGEQIRYKKRTLRFSISTNNEVSVTHIS